MSIKFLQKILTFFSTLISNSKEKNTIEQKYNLPFEIVSIDTGHDEIIAALPVRANIVDRKESPDGGEYYLAKLLHPINSQDRNITHLIVGGRMLGYGIYPEMEDLPINIAYVTNNDLINEVVMDFSKAEFTAIGCATASHIRRRQKR